MLLAGEPPLCRAVSPHHPDIPLIPNEPSHAVWTPSLGASENDLLAVRGIRWCDVGFVAERELSRVTPV